MCKKRSTSRVILFVLLIIGGTVFYLNENNFDEQHTKINPPISVQKLRSLNDTILSLLSNADFFKSHNETFMQAHTRDNRNICDVYYEDAKHRRFFIPSVWKEYLSVDPDGITLVTQLSFDRFFLIDLLIKHWLGPLSITICVNIEHLQVFGQTLVTQTTLLERDNIDFHIAIKSGVSELIYLHLAEHPFIFFLVHTRTKEFTFAFETRHCQITRNQSKLYRLLEQHI